MSLYDLKKDEIAFIESVVDHRLKEVGLYKGVEIKVIKAGNPCILKTAGMKICIGHVDVSVLR